MLAGCVRRGIAGPQHDGQRFPARPGTVIGERGQRVESERLLPGRRGILFLGVGQHDRGIQIHQDRRPSGAGCAVPGQRPGAVAGCGASRADGPQRPGRVRRQGADQPGHHRVGGHRAGQLRLGAQHCDISEAVPAQRQRHDQISNHLPRVMHRPRPSPPPQPAREALAQPGDPRRLGQQ